MTNFSILKKHDSAKDAKLAHDLSDNASQHRKIINRLKKREKKDKNFSRICCISAISALLLTISFVLALIKVSLPSFYATEVFYSKQLSEQFKQHKVYSTELLNYTEEELNKGIWIKARDTFDYYYRNRHYQNQDYNQIIAKLEELHFIRAKFNLSFFTNSDSINPEIAGIFTAVKGTLYSVTIFMGFLVIFGVLAGIYLSEFIRNKKIKYLLEVNVNNLKAIPSVIYGLIGLSFIINTLGVQRSSSLAAGLTLGFMLLPVVITTTQHSFTEIPQIIRDNALALGTTETQVVFRVLVWIALPKIITGLLLSLLRGIGETACLIIIGMVAYIQKAPSNISDPTTTIPVQILLWIQNPQNNFLEKASALSLILVLLVIVINTLAIIARSNKYANRGNTQKMII